MKVRLSKEEDLKAIMEIYALARKFMREQGNPTQWGEDYPSKLLIEADISSRQSFVVEEDGKIVGTFAFIIGEDPTYQVIEKGAWRSSLMERSIVSLQTAKSKVWHVRFLIFAIRRFPIYGSILMQIISPCKQLSCLMALLSVASFMLQTEVLG